MTTQIAFAGATDHGADRGWQGRASVKKSSARTRRTLGGVLILRHPLFSWVSQSRSLLSNDLFLRRG